MHSNEPHKLSEVPVLRIWGKLMKSAYGLGVQCGNDRMPRGLITSVLPQPRYTPFSLLMTLSSTS